MKIKILDKNTQNELFEIDKFRKNTTQKTIIEKVKETIRNIYGINVSRLLPTGTIDLATGKQDISYVIFGENTDKLPTRNIIIVKESE